MGLLGITSVTFRKLPAEEIIALVSEARLDGMEWGGDIHVPTGDLACARRVRDLTEAGGLKVLSYGSYYSLGKQHSFDEVLQTALALRAPVVRIWAGGLGSLEADPEHRRRAVAELKEILRKAGDQGISLGLEYHRRTLTDTWQSTLALLEACPGLHTYWQPNPDLTIAEHLQEIRALKPYICAVHLFHWAKGNVRLPLAAGEAAWQAYFQALAGLDCHFILEFVQDDRVEQFRADADTLKKMRKRA